MKWDSARSNFDDQAWLDPIISRQRKAVSWRIPSSSLIGGRISVAAPRSHRCPRIALCTVFSTDFFTASEYGFAPRRFSTICRSSFTVVAMGRPSKAVNKVKATIWLEPEVLSGLKRLADDRRVSLSELCGLSLRRLVQGEALEAQSELVGARLEQLVLSAVADVGDRLAYLCAAAAIEGGASRRMLMDRVIQERGLEEGRALAGEARKAAARAIRERPGELLKLVLEDYEKAGLS